MIAKAHLNTSAIVGETWQMLAIVFAFVSSAIIFSVIKKVFYRFYYRKRYYIFPRIGVKGITNIAMVISIAIAAIILLTIVSAGFMGVLFRAYPGWRVTIEGILIKIGGLLFGPIIGLFIGATTDILSVALTAGMFHYGYFLAAIAYGFFAGLIRSILNLTKNKQLSFIGIFMLIAMAILVFLIIFVNSQTFAANGAPQDYVDVTIFNISIHIYKWMLIVMLSVVFTFWISVTVVCLFIYDKPQIYKWLYEVKYSFKYKIPSQKLRDKLYTSKDKNCVVEKQLQWTIKNNDGRHKLKVAILKKEKSIRLNREVNWFSYFVPVVATVLIGESIVEIFMLPFFDRDFSSFGYDHWLVLRTIMFVVFSAMNTLVIYPVYRIVSPSMKYNYTNDLTEHISTPLMND